MAPENISQEGKWEFDFWPILASLYTNKLPNCVTLSEIIFNIPGLGHLGEKRSKLNEFYTEKRLFLAILTQSYIWQEDS